MIRALTPADSAAVAALHLQNLPTRFGGKPGLALLQLYYQNLAVGVGGCGYIAEDDGEIVGFVCGVWDPESLKRQLIQKDWLALGIWGCLAALRMPSILFDLPSRLKGRGAQAFPSVAYELRPIVVNKNFRGSGYAAQLVERLLADAVQRGFQEVSLFAEEENGAAVKFYKKVGFQEFGRVDLSGVVYIQFTRRCD